jgi:hypothetical protein
MTSLRSASLNSEVSTDTIASGRNGVVDITVLISALNDVVIRFVSCGRFLVVDYS